MSKDPNIYINDILNHINLAQEFASQMAYEELVKDLPELKQQIEKILSDR